jgi:hypothetical protein
MFNIEKCCTYRKSDRYSTIMVGLSWQYSIQVLLSNQQTDYTSTVLVIWNLINKRMDTPPVSTKSLTPLLWTKVSTVFGDSKLKLNFTMLLVYSNALYIQGICMIKVSKPKKLQTCPLPFLQIVNIHVDFVQTESLNHEDRQAHKSVRQ